jgi:hypothetical protein
LIPTDDFVHLKCRFPRFIAAGSQEATERAKPRPTSGLQLVIDNGDSA